MTMLSQLGGDALVYTETIGSYKDFDKKGNDVRLPEFCKGLPAEFIGSREIVNSPLYSFKQYNYGTRARACAGPGVQNNFRWQPVHVYRKR